jgi:hypothetical protein
MQNTKHLPLPLRLEPATPKPLIFKLPTDFPTLMAGQPGSFAEIELQIKAVRADMQVGRTSTGQFSAMSNNAVVHSSQIQSLLAYKFDQ